MIDTKNRKQQILETAAQLFHKQGYQAASMRELASLVGLKQASSLYSHYESKEAMLKDICFDNAQKFVDGMAQIEQSEQSAAQMLQQLLKLHIRIAVEDRTSIIVFSEEWRHLSEPHLNAFLDLRRDYEKRFLAIIQRGIEDQEIVDIDPQLALYTLLASLRWLHYSQKDWTIQRLQQDVGTFLLNGLLR